MQFVVINLITVFEEIWKPTMLAAYGEITTISYIYVKYHTSKLSHSHVFSPPSPKSPSTPPPTNPPNHQSLRIDRFNTGRPTRCILVYSGIHYDTIVQSPSEPPHTQTDSPPEFDRRVFDSDDDEILQYALELCRKLKEQHYFTDTGGMKIKCKVSGCGWTGYGEGQASGHASMSGHYDMEEVTT